MSSTYPPSPPSIAPDTPPPPFAAPTAVHPQPSIKHATFPSDKVDEGDADADGDGPTAVTVREIARTPSPTPTEARVLSEKARVCDWKKIFNWRRYANPRGVSEYHPSHLDARRAGLG